MGRRFSSALQCARRDDVQPMSEADSNQSQLNAKQSSTQPVLAQENFWDSQNSSRNCTTTFQFVSRWIQIRHDTFYSAGDPADSSISKYDGWQHNKKRLSLERVDTKDNTADLFTKHLDGPRTQSLARKLGLRFWKTRMVRTESI